MKRLLLDTHAWVWTLGNDDRLSFRAREALTQADTVLVSAISLFEIGQKVRLGKWPEMEPHWLELPKRLAQQGGRFVPVSAEISLMAARLNWAHRDPFDRFIAATAITERLALVSADAAFDDLRGSSGWHERVW